MRNTCFFTDFNTLCYQYGYSPEISVKIGGDSLQTSSWSQMIQVFFFFFFLYFSFICFSDKSLPFLNFNIHFLQLNYLKHFLGGGFIKHMQVVFLLALFNNNILVLLKNLFISVVNLFHLPSRGKLGK